MTAALEHGIADYRHEDVFDIVETAAVRRSVWLRRGGAGGVLLCALQHRIDEQWSDENVRRIWLTEAEALALGRALLGPCAPDGGL